MFESLFTNSITLDILRKVVELRSKKHTRAITVLCIMNYVFLIISATSQSSNYPVFLPMHVYITKIPINPQVNRVSYKRPYDHKGTEGIKYVINNISPKRTLSGYTKQKLFKFTNKKRVTFM